MPEAVFLRDGERFLPTELARGPWTPQAQHGGAPAALLARAVERFDGGEGMFVARLTIELLRPVPIAPLHVRTTLTRPGRKVQLVAATLCEGEREVARAAGLRIRHADLRLPAALHSPQPPPGPATGRAGLPPWGASIQYPAFHTSAVEHRFVGGSFEQPGPATDWIRLRVPLVLGEPTSPLCRVAAAADFGNGVSWVLNRSDGYSFINPDLTIYLYRLPAGEWICLDAATYVAPQSVGLAESRLFDERGLIGRAAQSLIVEQVGG